MLYDFKKDEFNYYATALIFGTRGSRIQEFKQYSFDVLRKYKDIKFTEMEALNVENMLNVQRTLRISAHKTFQTKEVKRSSGISQIITYSDSINNLVGVDAVFTDTEFKYFKEDWNIVVKEKIRTLGNLIRSIYLGDVVDVLPLVVRFPEITKLLIDHPEYWLKLNVKA